MESEMVKNNEDFELFQKVFREYQEKFGLQGYRVYFEHEPFGDDFAGISVDMDNMTATVRLNSRLPKRQASAKDVRRLAKHEALHLLLARLRSLALERFVTASEVQESSEEVVHRLEELIPGTST